MAGDLPGARPDRVLVAILACFVVGGAGTLVLAVPVVQAALASAVAAAAVVADALFRRPPER